MTTTNKATATRRGFLAAVGAGAAALAVPAGAVAASGQGTPLDALREWYRREIERLAEDLRPRFASGELRAMRHSDYDDDDSDAWKDADSTPFRLIDAAAAVRFGLGVKESAHGLPEGDESAAFLVLALSPHAPFIDTAAEHPGYTAQDAAAWDVIAHARAVGMYAPAADEFEDPAKEVRS